MLRRCLRNPARRWIGLALLILLAVSLRLAGIGNRHLWVDEAETAINALTILERGLPVDTYLDQPIYENTLVEPWPDHPEYEFRDSSYSRRGLAVYHGWLPLYATALALKLGGIEPDTRGKVPLFRCDPAEMWWRTAVPRLPSLLFAALFVLLAFKLGNALGPPATGWCAALIAAISEPAVLLGRDARYYGLTLVLTTACILALVRVRRIGRWRDFAGGALCFVALFHTHLLSALTVALLAPAAARRLPRHDAWLKKVALAIAIVAAGTVPWLALTGFFTTTARLPAARAMLDLPGELFTYTSQGWVAAICLLLAAIWGVGALPCRRLLPPRLAEVLVDRRWAALLLLTWGVTAFAVFTLAMPAVSYMPARLALVLLVPKLLFVALALGVVCHVVASRRASWMAVVATTLALWSTDRADAGERTSGSSTQLARLGHELNLRAYRPGTRFYGTPNWHLTLTYYLGWPIQTLAPVRKDFLDRWPDTVVVLEPVHAPERITERAIERLAADHGATLATADLQSFKRRLRAHVAAKQPLGGSVTPVAIDDIVARLGNDAVAELTTTTGRRGWWSGLLPFKSRTIESPTAAWLTYFMRFTQPQPLDERTAPFATRLRNAQARFAADHAFLVYESAGRPLSDLSRPRPR